MKQKSKKLIILFIISFIMILGFATIVKADGEFKINKETDNIVLNGARSYYTENKPTGETVTWSSSDTNIASVDSDGKVTAKAIGKATITAKAGTSSATCEINVVYNSYVKSNITDVFLVIGEYESKTITITATDYNSQDITNPEVQWKSSDESIAKVDSTGKITAVKAGTATITATVAGGTKNINVTVTNAPTFTDFSKAEYELVKTSGARVNLHVKNVENIENIVNDNSSVYFYITSQNQKPEIKLAENHSIDTKDTKWIKMSYDNENKYLYSTGLEEYVQLNQDLYLWIVEEKKLEKGYYDDENKYVTNKIEFVVSGVKLTRPKYPVYAEMFNSTVLADDVAQILFNLPGDETKRNFTLKIGKITDNNILNGIKNNNGDSWNSLLEYAKNSNAIFNNKLATTSLVTHLTYSSLDGAEKINLKLDNNAYYYMYVVFDDENGKYYPASGLTIAKASVHNDDKKSWSLIFLGDNDFKWDDFGTAQTGTTTDVNTTGTTTKTTTNQKSTKANTPSKLPYTGTATIGLLIVVMAGTAVFFKVKNNKYKGI